MLLSSPSIPPRGCDDDAVIGGGVGRIGTGIDDKVARDTPTHTNTPTHKWRAERSMGKMRTRAGESVRTDQNCCMMDFGIVCCACCNAS